MQTIFSVKVQFTSRFSDKHERTFYVDSLQAVARLRNMEDLRIVGHSVQHVMTVEEIAQEIMHERVETSRALGYGGE